MKLNRSLLVSAAFVAVAVVVAAWLYPRLPTEVPTHWNLHGHVDGVTPRIWAAALPALGIVGVVVLSVLLPAISPRRFEIRPFARVWDIVMLAVQGFTLVIGVAMLLAGAGYAMPMPTIAMLSVGVLLMVLGNYMGKLRKNFFIGIRTPWTLASDAVWERTHRLAGWLFMLAGLIVVIAALVSPSPWSVLAAVPAALLIPAAYSLLIYWRTEKRA